MPREPEPARRSRARTLVLAVLIAVMVVLGTHTARDVFPPPPPALEASVPAAAYTVTYREFLLGDVTNEVRLAVQRPFSSRRETIDSSGDIRGRTVTNLEYTWTLNNDVDSGYLRKPSLAPGDVSYDALRMGIADDLVRYTGVRSILDRSCAVFELASERHPLGPPGEERTELCVTREGIVLARREFLDGHLTRDAEAIDLRIGDVSDEELHVGRVPNASEFDELIAVQLQVQDEQSVTDFGVTYEIPSRFALLRRSEVAESRGQAAAASGAVVEAFADDVEPLIVERSFHSNLVPPWDPTVGTPVGLPISGDARLVRFVDRVEVRAVGEWGYARVTARDARTALPVAESLALVD